MKGTRASHGGSFSLETEVTLGRESEDDVDKESMKWGLFLEVGRGSSPLGLARMGSSVSLGKSEGRVPEFSTRGQEQRASLLFRSQDPWGGQDTGGSEIIRPGQATALCACSKATCCRLHRAPSEASSDCLQALIPSFPAIGWLPGAGAALKLTAR